MTPRNLSQGEFIALTAMLFATIAFSIDAMLPALPEIAASYTPDAPNRAQLVVTSFVFGMGAGTLFAGPLSDALGRKRTIMAGALLYCLGAALAAVAPSLEWLLAARVVQGLGAAGPRVVSLAMVRDLYAGRQMARVISFAMMIFTLVPAFAPLIGGGIMHLAGWHGIFVAFILFSLLSMLWLGLRQPETLPPAARRPLNGTALVAALREVLGNRIALTTIAVQTLVAASLFALISSTQQIFDQRFDRGDSFAYWFALIALFSGSASFINARLVVRLGMRVLVSFTLRAQVVLSGGFALAMWLNLLPAPLDFAAFVLWSVTVFMMVGMTLGNLNALALEPLGHIAGMAASVAGSVSTVLAVGLAVPLGLAFDGTPVPLATGILVLVALGAGLMARLPRRTA